MVMQESFPHVIRFLFLSSIVLFSSHDSLLASCRFDTAAHRNVSVSGKKGWGKGDERERERKRKRKGEALEKADYCFNKS